MAHRAGPPITIRSGSWLRRSCRRTPAMSIPTGPTPLCVPLFPPGKKSRMPSPMTLATVIRSGGLAKLKGQRIQEILHTLKARQGGLCLDFLMDMPMPAARAFLAEFSGVGPKTIACVLLFACGHPAFPVDTHIYRVTTRLGLLPAGCTAERAHSVLEPLIPPAQVYAAHVNLIRHGRTVCKARLPNCQHCCLRTSCPFPQPATQTGAVRGQAPRAVVP